MLPFLILLVLVLKFLFLCGQLDEPLVEDEDEDDEDDDDDDNKDDDEAEGKFTANVVVVSLFPLLCSLFILSFY